MNEEPNINEGALQLMKFHGSYQQDDRDKRGFGKGKAYQFMMRTRQPAGLVSNQLYLTMDDLADQVSPYSCMAFHSIWAAMRDHPLQPDFTENWAVERLIASYIVCRWLSEVCGTKFGQG